MPHSLLFRAAAALVAGLLAATAALAQQDYPNRPIKVVVPFSPGGAVDGPMRAIAQELGKRLNQQVIIENKPGAGATIGSEMVAKAAPDGYTLLLASQTNAISATLYSKLSFNPIDDFVAISLLGREPGVLVVHPSLPVQERGRAGRLRQAATGPAELRVVGQRQRPAPVHGDVRVDGRHPADARAVPRQRPGHDRPARPARCRCRCPARPAWSTHIKAGKLRPLATSGVTRSSQLPEVPTLAESGLAGYSAYVWMGLLAPKGTPPAIVERLHRELKASLAAPEVKAFFTEAGVEIVGSTPAEFDAYFREERDRWARVVKETGAKID